MASSEAVDWPVGLGLPLVGNRRKLQPRSFITRMDSKRTRVRRSYETYLDLVDFDWNFTEDEFDTFKTFFEDSLLNGTYPFVITLVDIDDSSQYAITEYAFWEATYSFSRSDNLVNVFATCVVLEEEVEAIPEFNPGLCGVVIWPQPSGGFGGGTTFQCYDVRDNYVDTGMEPAGTGLSFIYLGDSKRYVRGETYEYFNVGDLVLGSASPTSGLSIMYYGSDPLGVPRGEDFESYALGAISDGTPPTATGLTSYFSGDGPP